MSSFVSILLIISWAIQISDAIRCQSCFNYNGLACVANPECVADYCIYEQIIRPDGVVSVRKGCSPIGQYEFDDGTPMTNLNQCVTRTTSTGQYYVLLCSSGDDCNSQCVTIPNPTLPPTDGLVSCYNCISYDGNDCQTNICQGKFCIYERRVTNNQLMMRKSCSDTSVIQLDDGTVVDTVGQCEIRDTLSYRYYTKACNDANLCNNYCNPDVTTEPQRQPTVTCYDCEAYGSDCFTGRCVAQYCLYEKQKRLSSGTTYVKRSCTNAPFVEYPDNRPSTALNNCETRTIGDVQYQVRVCNDGNLCNTQCAADDEPLVTCYECQAVNQMDCTTGSCQGKYCLFTRSQTSAGSYVKKSCTNTETLFYVDNVTYQSFGQCEFRQINGTNYDFKLCNSSSMCNSACPLGPVALLS
ncbi:hypothetical protein Q1695_011047 [Nippostrongylus brasiliensis]|nr:hypothetical protein Q1695_011047 [Nippostrongylus brasiliensis]